MGKRAPHVIAVAAAAAGSPAVECNGCRLCLFPVILTRQTTATVEEGVPVEAMDITYAVKEKGIASGGTGMTFSREQGSADIKVHWRAPVAGLNRHDDPV